MFHYFVILFNEKRKGFINRFDKLQRYKGCGEIYRSFHILIFISKIQFQISNLSEKNPVKKKMFSSLAFVDHDVDSSHITNALSCCVTYNVIISRATRQAGSLDQLSF